jgi:preprotein translocase subunit SecA
MAGRGTDIVLGPGVTEAGGLHVIGTERHEARRVDNQLRGRCARQGDPGSTTFFLSLEDDLMRRFASDRVSAILKRLGMKEGEEISHPWVTKSITRAQKKVENYHYEIRKNLLEYDGVMNEQRQLVYDMRQRILEGENLSAMVRSMMQHTVETRVDYYLSQDYSLTPEVEDDDEAESDANAPERMPRRSAAASAPAEPVDPISELRTWVRASYGFDLPGVELRENQDYSDQREFFVEGIMSAFDNAYDEKRASLGDEMMARVERFILLMEIDDRWKDHLRAMDHLRQAIGLRGYAQKDPKVAYKQEGYEMFQEMIENLRANVSQLVLRVRVREEDERALEQSSQLENAQYEKDEATSAFGEGQRAQDDAAKPTPTGPVKPIVNEGPKIGRNDPCPCGSGKKYKKCCGVAGE